jgi:hypothetical protein
VIESPIIRSLLFDGMIKGLLLDAPGAQNGIGTQSGQPLLPRIGDIWY